MILGATFAKIASATASVAGNPLTFLAAVTLVLAWALAGPMFGFSETWQLVVNTGTTIATFLMVFLVQNTQNRDAIAIQVKLDELLRAVDAARNDLVGVEHEAEAELRQIRDAVEDDAGAGVDEKRRG